jgi:hypothetical protein
LPKFSDAASSQQLSELGDRFTDAKERALAELRG